MDQLTTLKTRFKELSLCRLKEIISECELLGIPLKPSDIFCLPPLPVQLNPRETEVLGMVCLQMRNEEIAHRMNISVYTVMRHKQNLKAKVGRVGLGMYALSHDLLNKDGYVFSPKVQPRGLPANAFDKELLLELIERSDIKLRRETRTLKFQIYESGFNMK